MNKNIIIATATASLFLGGCTEFMDGYNDARAHRGEPGYNFPERLARVGDALAQGAGDFATGYAEASPIYVQPQHGAMSGTTINWGGQTGMSTTWINY